MRSAHVAPVECFIGQRHRLVNVIVVIYLIRRSLTFTRPVRRWKGEENTDWEVVVK